MAIATKEKPVAGLETLGWSMPYSARSAFVLAAFAAVASGPNWAAPATEKRTVEPETTFFRHDCNEAFDFAAGRTFDIVFAGEVIEHIYDDARFLREIHRILSPGGVLSLTTPNLFFLVNRIVLPFGRMPYFAYAPFHYYFYSRRTLTALVEESGFEVRGLTSSHVLVSTRRHRILGRLCERLGDVFPSLGAHLILFATKKGAGRFADAQPRHKRELSAAKRAPGTLATRNCATPRSQS